MGLERISWQNYGGGFDTLVSATAPFFWFFFLLSGLALFVLRWTQPNIERPFRVPLYPFLPLLFCLMSCFMLYSSLVYARELTLLAGAPLLLGVPLYFVKRRMPNDNPYAGETLDFSSRRSIEIRRAPDGGTINDASDTSALIDYFFHDGEFWTAMVPLDAIDQVRGQAFNFSKPKTKASDDGPQIQFDRDGLPKRSLPLLNHVQSRFMVKPSHSIELYPLGTEKFIEPVHRINDFIYSIEAVGPVGVMFNLRDGLNGSLRSAHRFVSTSEMVFERIVVDGRTITESPPLSLRDGEKRNLLIRSLIRSHRAGTSEPYYLYRFCGTNNCTSNPFQILDQVVQYNLRQRLGSMLYRLPLNPRFYLRIRGLDSDPSVRGLVRQEFEEFVGDPETKKRKRAYVRRRVREVRAARAVRATEGRGVTG